MIKEKRTKGTLHPERSRNNPCRKNQTLLVSRSGPDNVSVTVRLASAEEEEVAFGSIASAEEEEEWDDRSITSVEGEDSDDGSIETIECNDDVLPFDIEDCLEELHEFSGVGYSESDAQYGSKAYYRSHELLEQQFLEFSGGVRASL